MVPKGLTNLANGKRVTSSDGLPVIGDLQYITDGDKAASDGSYVELGPQKQWVQVDLEQQTEIHGIWLWHFHKNARVYGDVIAQISHDENFSANSVVTVYNSDHDNSCGLGQGSDPSYVETNGGRVINARATEGRYLRFYSNGNTSNEMNHYIEIEVWGRAPQLASAS